MNKEIIEKVKKTLAKNAEKFARTIVEEATGCSWDYTFDVYVNTSNGEINYTSGFGTVGMPKWAYDDDNVEVLVKIKIDATRDQIFDYWQYILQDNSPCSNELYAILCNTKEYSDCYDIINKLKNEKLKEELQSEIDSFKIEYDEHIDNHIHYYTYVFEEISSKYHPKKDMQEVYEACKEWW